jgi:hypothetical protein
MTSPLKAVAAPQPDALAELGAAAGLAPLEPTVASLDDVFRRTRQNADGPPAWTERTSLDDRAFWHFPLWQLRDVRSADGGVTYARSETKLQKYDASGLAWEFDAAQTVREDAHIRGFIDHPDGVTARLQGHLGGYDVVGLDSNGKLNWRWQAPAGHEIDSIRRGPHGETYVKSDRLIRALDARGEQMWQIELPGHVDRMLHIAGPDGRQYFPSQQASRDMNHDWFSHTPPATPFLPPDAYVRAERSLGGNFCYVVEPDGTLGPPALDDMHSIPLRLGDRLFYGGGQGVLHCADLSGGPGWTLQLDRDAELDTPYTGHDGNLYCQTRGTDGRLFVVSPHGTLLARHAISDAHFDVGGATFHAAADGSFYYAGTDGKIHERRADGTRGRSWPGAPGEEMGCGDDGHLYVWREDNSAHSIEALSHKSLDVINLANGAMVSLPLDGYAHMRVLTHGVLEFYNTGQHAWYLRPRADAQVEALLGNLQAAPAKTSRASTATPIVRDEKSVVIDGVRLPVRQC